MRTLAQSYKYLLVGMLLACSVTLPGSQTAQAESARVWVSLDYAGGHLALYVLDTHGRVEHEFPIAGPIFRPACLHTRDVYGYVADVSHHATWVPTPSMHRKARKRGTRLKKMYAWNDPNNALAGRRVDIEWDPSGCIDQKAHIHGSYQRTYIENRARASSGCYRMLVEHWEQLAQFVSVGDLVIVSAHPPPSHLSARD